MLKFLCGVPDKLCSGASINMNWGPDKLHKTPEEAFKCYAKYLISIGYIQVGNREFKTPFTGEILVLTKKCRFGAACRQGKKAPGTESRSYLPDCGRHTKSGTIVSL